MTTENRAFQIAFDENPARAEGLLETLTGQCGEFIRAAHIMGRHLYVETSRQASRDEVRAAVNDASGLTPLMVTPITPTSSYARLLRRARPVAALAA